MKLGSYLTTSQPALTNTSNADRTGNAQADAVRKVYQDPAATNHLTNAAPSMIPVKRQTANQAKLLTAWLRNALPRDDTRRGAAKGGIKTESQEKNNAQPTTTQAPLVPQASRAPDTGKSMSPHSGVPFYRFVYSELAEKLIALKNLSPQEAEDLKSRIRHIEESEFMKNENIPLIAMTYFERISKKNPDLDGFSVLVGAVMLADKYINDRPIGTKHWTIPTKLSLADVNRAQNDALKALDYRIEIKPEELETLREKMEIRYAPSLDAAYLKAIFNWVDGIKPDSVPVSSSNEKPAAVSVKTPQDRQAKKDSKEAKELRLKSARDELAAINGMRRKYEDMAPHVEEKKKRIAELEEKIKSRNPSRFSTINGLRSLMRERQFRQAGKLDKSDTAYEQELNDLRSWMKDYDSYRDTTQSAQGKEKREALIREVIKLSGEVNQLSKELNRL